MPEPHQRAPAITSADWQGRYEARETPWDTGIVDRELRDYIESGTLAPELAVKPCRALELGCGTGINAVFLAECGFDVTAVDFAANAVEAARRRAESAGRNIEFLTGDVTNLTEVAGPFSFVFDRGCYHCVRRAGGLGGYLKTLERITTARSRLLILAGNPDAGEPGGPPKVTAAEFCGDFQRHSQIERLVAMRFEEAGHVEGPLGWRLELVRRQGC